MNTRLLDSTLPPLPADRCPYVSGRAGGFERCPVFRSVVWLPTHPLPRDFGALMHEPAPLITCAHLTIGAIDMGRFYPRCRLGTPAARGRYARGGRPGTATSWA
jgi:hypothetical protein